VVLLLLLLVVSQMSLSPQKVDFEKIWSGLQAGVAHIITLTGVKGMPMIE